MGVRSTLITTTTSSTALSTTTSATLDGTDIARLKGWGFRFLWVLKVHIKLYNGVKVLELLAVSQDSALNGAKRQVCDPLFKEVDLDGLLQGRHILLKERCMTIMLHNMSSAILVKVKVLVVPTVVQGL